MMIWIKKHWAKVVLAVSLSLNFYFGNRTTSLNVASNNPMIGNQTFVYGNATYKIISYNFDAKPNDQAIVETKAVNIASGETVKLAVSGNLEIAKWGEAKWGEAKWE